MPTTATVTLPRAAVPRAGSEPSVPRRVPSHTRQSSAGTYGFVAVPAANNLNNNNPAPLLSHESSPTHPGAVRAVNFVVSPQRGPNIADQLDLPPLEEGYEYQPVRIIAHGMDMPRVIEDPSAYRPATPILNWQGPKRSIHPPWLPFWLPVSFMCLISTLLAGIIPNYLSSDSTLLFLLLWTPSTCIFVGFFCYLSTSRHLQLITMQMEGISTPSDLDFVLEKLEGGRFSRFEETWKVQVHLILMFCRLLRHHHGLKPSHIQRYHRHDELSGGDEETELFSETDDPAAPATEGNTAVHVGSPNLQRTLSRRGSRQFVIPEEELDNESLYTANSDEMEASQNASKTATTSRRAMRSSSSKVMTPYSRKDTPGSPNRKRKVCGDPLDDNSKDWEAVMSAGSDEGPPKSLFLQLLKQVKLGQDLSKVVLPVHILEPRSLLEKISDLFVHPQLLGSIDQGLDPVDRVKRLCRWFLSAYNMRPKGVKKPYNPILGETFECHFAPGTDEELWYFAEQVSHHPPITCFRAVHRRTQVEVVGSYVPRSKLVTPNTGASIGDGFFDVYIPRFNESYRLGWPSAYVSGVVSPPLRLELVGEVNVTSRSTDVRAEIHFERKPYFGGDYDEVRGGIFLSTAKYPSYVISGKWHSKTEIRKRRDAVALHKACVTDEPPIDLFDPSTTAPTRPTAGFTAFPKPSRVVWKSVTLALRAGDAEEAQTCKAAIEGAEREVRRAREARGEEYVPGFFRIVGDVKGVGKDTWRFVGPTPYGHESPFVAAMSGSRIGPPSGSPVVPTIPLPLPLPATHGSPRIIETPFEREL